MTTSIPSSVPLRADQPHRPASPLVAVPPGVKVARLFEENMVKPFVLQRLGFDPAASSAPFVATLVDVTGLVIYFSVAVVVLRGTLL